MCELLFFLSKIHKNMYMYCALQGRSYAPFKVSGTPSQVRPSSIRPFRFLARFRPSILQPPHCLKKKAACQRTHSALSINYRSAIKIKRFQIVTTQSRPREGRFINYPSIKNQAQKGTYFISFLAASSSNGLIMPASTASRM